MKTEVWSFGGAAEIVDEGHVHHTGEFSGCVDLPSVCVATCLASLSRALTLSHSLIRSLFHPHRAVLEVVDKAVDHALSSSSDVRLLLG